MAAQRGRWCEFLLFWHFFHTRFNQFCLASPSEQGRRNARAAGAVGRSGREGGTFIRDAGWRGSSRRGARIATGTSSFFLIVLFSFSYKLTNYCARVGGVGGAMEWEEPAERRSRRSQWSDSRRSPRSGAARGVGA